MGEIAPTRSERVRRVVSNWVMPPKDKEFYRQIDDQFEGMVYKLQRMQQQVKGLTEDTGLYKPRWAAHGIGDYNPEEISYDEYKKMINYDSQVIAGFDINQIEFILPINSIIPCYGKRVIIRRKADPHYYSGLEREVDRLNVEQINPINIVFDICGE